MRLSNLFADDFVYHLRSAYFPVFAKIFLNVIRYYFWAEGVRILGPNKVCTKGTRSIVFAKSSPSSEQLESRNEVVK